jgi:hypothetical protein
VIKRNISVFARDRNVIVQPVSIHYTVLDIKKGKRKKKGKAIPVTGRGGP